MKNSGKTVMTIVVILVCACGCARVRAYERGRLAHPTMAPSYSHSPGRAHAQAIHEGAMGGSSIPSSGCGCN